ncbi:MAG: biotin/lipoate A/B protein ligase family protein [Gemmatimonadota bacterium]
MDLLVLETAAGDPAANLAWEEALVRAAPAAPVLRIWQNPRCVVLGRAQRAEREVDLAACAAAGVPVLRRASGGGTVYHDLGNLNISLTAPGWEPGLAADLAGLLAGLLQRLGVAAAVTSRGVFAGPVKVSGLASQLTRGATLAHATLLVTTPAAQVTAFLRPAPPDPRPLDSHRSPVSPLSELARGLSVPAARAAVLAAATGRYGTLAPRPPRPPETGWQQRLLAQRYRSDTWHLAGRGGPAEWKREAQWTTRPAASCTG